MSWTDEKIDKLFQDKAGEASFEYKGEYWQEMNSMLDAGAAVGSDALTDDQLDKMYQEDASNTSIDYKPEYWTEMEAMLPVGGAIPVEEGATDVDALYKAKAEGMSFTYKPEYFGDIDALLPVAAWRSIDVAWFITAFVFVGMLVMTPIIKSELNSNVDGVQLADENSNLDRGPINDEEGSIASSGEETYKADALNNENEDVSLSDETTNSNISGIDNKVDNNRDVSNMVVDNSNADVTENTIDNSNVSVVDGNDNQNQDNRIVNTGDNNADVVTDNTRVDNSNGDANDVQETGDNNADVVVADNRSVDNSNNDANDVQETGDQNNADVDSNIDNSQAELNKEIQLEAGNIDKLPLRELLSSNPTAEIENKVYDFDFKMPARTSFYIDAMGGVSQSLISPSDQASYSYGVGVGVQIQKGKFVIGLGANGLISNHKDILLSRQAKVYGFGSDLFSYELNYKQLYTIEANISLAYKMGRHGINFGVKPSFVVNSKVGMLDGTLGDDAVERDYYGYMDGINRFGIKPTLGYSFDINSKWMVGLNIGMQIMPSVNEDFIDGVNNKLPIDGQLYLRRSISFKK